MPAASSRRTARAPATPQRRRRRFRPEIEGLRAVAALLIAIYHIYLGRVSGGVDVFFVVAGFLVIGSLLGRRTSTGAVDVPGYLARLMRRLLPLSLTVLVAVTVAALLWLPASRQQATFGEVVASALYVENWELARKSVDYLARDTAVSPVQHFWAMSLQGQMYLLALVVTVVVVSIARRRVEPVLAAVLAVLVVASLGFSVWLTSVNQPLAYFHTGARVWEFALGGLLALAVARAPELPRRVKLPAGWLGLLMIVSCGVVFPVSTSFPGWIALWPVLGAVLVIVAGGSGHRWSADRLLGSRPLMNLGSISYGIYLWHWPLLVFYLHLSGRSQAPWWAGVLIIVATIALAGVSTRYIERPFRRRRRRAASWRPVLVGMVSVGVAVGVVGGVQAVTTHEETPSTAQPDVRPLASQSDPGRAAHPGRTAHPGPAVHPGAGAMAEGAAPVPDAEPIPDVASLLSSRPSWARNCHQHIHSPTAKVCTLGDPDSETTVLLAGGSHSAHWLPALERIAGSQGWRLQMATKSSCLFTTRPGGSGDARASCEAWNAELMQLIAEDPPDLLVMTSTRGVGAQEHVPPGYLDRWRELDELGVSVLAIRDNPRGGFHRAECLEAQGTDSAGCDAPRADLLAPEPPSASLSDPPTNVTFVDLTRFFCDDTTCPAVIGNVVVYADRHHMTEAYATTLVPVLEPYLVDAL